MNSTVLLGIAFGAAVALLVLMVARRLLRMGRFERAVRAHLGDAADSAYNETTMIHFYDHNGHAADAAREMAGAYRGP